MADATGRDISPSGLVTNFKTHLPSSADAGDQEPPLLVGLRDWLFVWLHMSLTGNRYAVRPMTVVLHEFFEAASIPDSPYGNSHRIANVLMFVLVPFVGLLIATVMDYLSKEPRMDANERE